MAVPSDTPAGGSGRDRKQCDLCRANCAKYKCPLCPVEFCSSSCYKDHRERHNADLSRATKLQMAQIEKERREHVELLRTFTNIPDMSTYKPEQGEILKTPEMVKILRRPPRVAKGEILRCVVCGGDNGVYKCPACSRRYCSPLCNTAHREKHFLDDMKKGASVAAPQEPAPKKRKTDQLHPFSVLDNAPELRQLFAKHPNLATRLDAIYEKTLPPKDQPAAATAGGLPWKVPATDARGRKEDQEPWTQDVGLRRGQKALRDARADLGDDGRAVREFCNLIMDLLSKESDEEGAPATTHVGETLMRQDFTVIKNMLERDYQEDQRRDTGAGWKRKGQAGGRR